MEERIIAELQALFAGESSGHDLFHTLRVTRTAQRIASQLPCDRELVTLGALLHDADGTRAVPENPAWVSGFHYAHAYPAKEKPQWARGCVGYQIFPDRFRRVDVPGGGVFICGCR